MRNAAAALAFYVEAFGAVEASRLVGDDGRVGHSEIEIGSSRLMIADECPEIDSVGPETRGGSTLRSHAPSLPAPQWCGQSPISSTATYGMDH